RRPPCRAESILSIAGNGACASRAKHGPGPRYRSKTMAGLECVSDQDLRAYLLGRLSERVSQLVCSHLQACARCEAAARRLARCDEPVIRSLRRAACLAADDTGVTLASACASDQATPADPVLPSRIAGYEILEVLGRGGMSVVYKARQAHPDRLVAVKM